MFKIIEEDKPSVFLAELHEAIKEGWKVHTFSTSSTGSSSYCDEPIDDMSTTYIAFMETDPPSDDGGRALFDSDEECKQFIEERREEHIKNSLRRGNDIRRREEPINNCLLRERDII